MIGRPAVGPRSMFQRWPGRIGGLLTALACACLCAGPAWSQAALVPNAIQQFFDANGNPLSSGFVYFYVPGTTSPKTVWQDAGQTIPYANPIQLNAAGEPNTAAGIWGTGNYRQIVQDQLQNLIWDAVTSTPGTSSGGGGTSGDGMPIGFIMAYAGPTAPSGYDFAYGQSYSRTGFPTLLGALTITQNGTCTNGSGNITALADTSQMGVGQAIESTCLPPGTTISAILSSSSVSVNALATGISGTYSLQVFPFGNGNGATTFQLPDLRGYGLAGRDNMGGTAANVLTAATRTSGWDLLGAVGGVEALTLATSQLPAHSHEILVNDPGHFHVFTYTTSAAGSGGAAQTTNIDAFGDATLTNTQAQTTGITATAASAGGGVATAATLGAPTSQALASGTVSFGGGSYTNGASVSLTVTGGTCATQPVVLATVSGNKVTAINSVATPGACAVPPTNPATLSDGTHVSATIVGIYGDGSGYTTGSQVLTVLGGTCSVQPQFTVTVAGGSVTTVNSLTTAGLCTVPPLNPAATSGGGGVGATLAVTYSTRPTAIVQPTVAINYVIKVNTNSGAFTIPIANNTVVGNNSGVTNPPTAITAPAVLAMICNTRGAILEDSATGWGCVAPGTTGYVWTSNGAGADPTYQPPPGGGPGGPVTGPATSLLNGTACWANASGTVLENCPKPFLFLPSVAPSSLGGWSSFATSFTGDNSEIFLGVKYQITGTASLGEPTSGYQITPELTPYVTYMVNGSGWNNSTSSNVGRTAAISNLSYLGNGGQGDAVNFWCNDFFSTQTRVGYTNWLANPAVTCVAGVAFGGANGQFANPFTVNVQDLGNDLAMIGYNVTGIRTANSGAAHPEVLPTGWWAFQANVGTGNTKPWDAIIGGLSVPVLIGVDLTGITTQSSGTWTNDAIQLKSGDRLYLDGVPNALSANGPGNGTPGEEFIEGNGTCVVVVAGNIPSLQACPTEVIIAAVPLVMTGTGSGVVTIQPQASAGTYNFNLPTTAGVAGQVLTSQGGGATAMTWTSQGQILPLSSAGAVAQNSTVFQVSAANATEGVAQAIAPKAGTFRNLYIATGTIGGSAQTVTATLRIAGSGTTITCQVLTAATTCNDITHSAAITAGQSYSLQVVTSATTGSVSFVSGGVEFDSP